MTDLYRIKELEWEDTTSGGFESGSYWIKHVKHSLAKNKYYLHRCGELISGYEFSVQAKAAANDHHRKEVGKMLTNTRTPSPTLRQIKSVEVVYRWYWFIKPKPKSSENKWVATCWKGSSEAEANEVASSDAYIADVGSRESKLVREETIFSVTDPSEELLSTPDRQLLRQAVEALESCKKWMKDEFIEAGEVKERIANIDETLSAIKQELGEKE